MADAQKVLGDQSRIRKDEAGWIASQLGLERGHVAGAVRLFQEGSTLPFIARYRKEQTGSMNEEDLRRVQRELNRVKDLETRRARVALALQRGRHLTPDLSESLLQAESIEDIDGLWAPFKAKRQTRAQVAKSLGLEPLATFLEEAAKQVAPSSAEPLEDAENREATAAGGDEVATAPPEKTPAEAAAQFITPEVPNVEAVLKAARDILAEQFAHRGDVRQLARSLLESKVRLQARRRGEADPEEQFKTYWDFSAPLRQVKPHQFLAVQRGEVKKCLSLTFAISEQDATCLLDALMSTFLGDRCTRHCIEATPTPMRAAAGKQKGSLGGRAEHRAEIRLALEDAYKRLLLPFLEREWRRRLKQQAEDEAFDTYRRNLKKKLLSAPLRLHPEWGQAAGSSVAAVLGVDPAFRTGCKCALISPTGQVLTTKTLFPHPSHANASVPAVQAEGASSGLQELLARALGADVGEGPEAEEAPPPIVVAGGQDGLEGEPPSKRRRCTQANARVVCSLGNGTASRETEAWLRLQLKQKADARERVGYAVVDESGASVYSASKLAGEELPELDVSMRGAVSIARRLLDPLSELVKIDPRSIGVGLYQHDVDQRRLAEELKGATMDCVNAVGVDLNTASPAILEHVSGLTATLARSIIQHRSEIGHFKSRAELLSVRGFLVAFSRRKKHKPSWICTSGGDSTSTA